MCVIGVYRTNAKDKTMKGSIYTYIDTVDISSTNVNLFFNCPCFYGNILYFNYQTALLTLPSK